MTTENQTEKKYPTHNLYFLTDKKGSDSKDWNKVGAAWIHADGEGFSIYLDLMGQKIPLTMRKYKPKES